LVIYGCSMPILLTQFYVIPYQTAMGQLLVDGGVDWSRGEALLALSAAALHVPLGLTAAIVIKRRYSPKPQAVPV